MKFFLKIVVAGVCILDAASGMAESNSPVCKEFRKLLDAPNGSALRQAMLQSSMTNGGEEQYLNMDIDGDDLSDLISGGCPASLQSGDPCNLSIALSSGKKQLFMFEQGERFYLTRYRSRIYAVVNDRGAEGGKQAQSIVKIDKSGINRICTWPKKG